MAYSKNRRLAEIVSDTAGNLSVEGIIVPTQSNSDNDTSAASTAFVHAHIDAVLDSAPGTLNTLNEIAAALNDDANFNTTVTNAIAAKLPLAGGTLTGALTVAGVIDTTTSHNLAINTPNSTRINIDSNADGSNESFIVGKDQTSVNQNNILFKVQENGRVGIGNFSDPDADLEVRGSTVISTVTDGVNSILMGLSGSNRTTIQFDTADTTHTNRQWGLTNIAGDFYIGRHGLNVMTMLNNGKVGIGTSSIDNNAKLHIEDSAYPIINLDRSSSLTTGNHLGYINFQNNGDVYGYMGVWVESASGTDGKLMFGTQNGTSLTDKMTINSTGHLTLLPASGFSGLNNSLLGSSNGYMYAMGGTAGLYLADNSALQNAIGIRDAGFIDFITAGSERMRITSAGIVDINKPASGYGAGSNALNLYGDGEVFRIDGSGGASRSLRFRGVGTNGSSNAIIVSDGSLQLKNEDANAAMYFNSVRNMDFQVTSGNGTAGHMTFSSYNTEIMRIDGANNRVGIGTAAPPSPLSIFGLGTSSPIAANAQQSYDNALLRINNFGNSSVGLSIGSTGSNWTHLQTSYNEGTTSPLALNPFGGGVYIGTNTALFSGANLQIHGSTDAGGSTQHVAVKNTTTASFSSTAFVGTGRVLDFFTNSNNDQDFSAIRFTNPGGSRETAIAVVEDGATTRDGTRQGDVVIQGYDGDGYIETQRFRANGASSSTGQRRTGSYTSFAYINHTYTFDHNGYSGAGTPSNSNPHWLEIPLYSTYSSSAGGGWVEIDLCWHATHAQAGHLHTWKLVWGSNHTRILNIAVVSNTATATAGSYGPYQFTSTSGLYRHPTAGDAYMGKMYIRMKGSTNHSGARSITLRGVGHPSVKNIAPVIDHNGDNTPDGISPTLLHSQTATG